MEQYKIAPYIRVAWDDYSEREDWYIAPRVIFDYEIIYLMGGELELKIEDQSYRVYPGDFIIIRPMQLHSIRSVSKEFVHQPHVHFDLQEDEYSKDVYVLFKELKDVDPSEYKLFRKDILGELCPNIPSVIRTPHYQQISKLLMMLIEEKSKRIVYSDLLAKGLFMQMFSLLLREAKQAERSVKRSDDEIAWKAQKYLNANLDRSVSLDELSKQIHVSKYYLSHRFKEVFGVSPMQYHMDSRIEYAKKMLANTSDSIGSIAEQVGFGSIYSFSRAFKQREHVSPTVYRKV